MMASAQHDPRRAGTIWAVNLDPPLPLLRPRIPAEFRRAGPESATVLADAASRDQAEILRRFEAGTRCYTAWVGEQLGDLVVAEVVQKKTSGGVGAKRRGASAGRSHGEPAGT